MGIWYLDYGPNEESNAACTIQHRYESIRVVNIIITTILYTMLQSSI